jgi:hypothetical protein
MRSFRLFHALAPCALAALLVACSNNNTTNATNAGGASVASTSTTNQTTTMTVQTNATNQSSAPGAASNSSGTSSNAGAPSSSSSAKKVDACALLTSDDIKSVQGEEVRETKPSQTGEGALAASQCFFATATFNKSVSLQVTRGADAQSVRRYWDTLFARAKEEGGKSEKEREREKREREKKKEDQKGAQPKGGEEEEESAPPTPVKGVGDEAFWATSNVNGILYALKGDAFVRVSIGGSDKPDVRLRKSKALAQKALARL